MATRGFLCPAVAACVGALVLVANPDVAPLSASDCACPAGFQDDVDLHSGTCYGHMPPADTCRSRPDGHTPAGAGTWCWSGKLTTFCSLSPWAVMRGPVLALAAFLPGVLGHAAPAAWSALQIRASPEDPQAAVSGCAAQSALIGASGPDAKSSESKQAAVVVAGLHREAVGAMRRHPDHLGLQKACAELLKATVAWNAWTMGPVAEAGAMGAVLDYFRRFSHLEDVLYNIGIIGHFMDFNERNQERFLEEGGLLQFVEWAKTNHTPQVACQFQCIVSTQGPMPNRDFLVSHGYFPLTIKHMRDFRSEGCSRGENIWDMRLGFWQKPEWLADLYRLGYAEEVLAAMRDELEAHDAGRSLDPIGPRDKIGMARLMESAMMWLGEMARGNATRSAALVRLGFFDEVLAMLRRGGDLERRAVWGGAFDATAAACETLLIVAKAAPEEGVAALRKSGVLGEIERVVAARRDKRSLGTCHTLSSAYVLS